MLELGWRPPDIETERLGEKTIDIIFFLQVPIYARAQDLSHLLDLKKAGATDVVLENAEVIFETGFVFTKRHSIILLVIFFLLSIFPSRLACSWVHYF